MIISGLTALWRWLFGCSEPGCHERPVSLGRCERHADPYEYRDEYFGP